MRIKNLMEQAIRLFFFVEISSCGSVLFGHLGAFITLHYISVEWVAKRDFQNEIMINIFHNDSSSTGSDVSFYLQNTKMKGYLDEEKNKSSP